jgi:hypothetical protein
MERARPRAARPGGTRRAAFLVPHWGGVVAVRLEDPAAMRVTRSLDDVVANPLLLVLRARARVRPPGGVPVFGATVASPGRRPITRLQGSRTSCSVRGAGLQDTRPW